MYKGQTVLVVIGGDEHSLVPGRDVLTVVTPMGRAISAGRPSPTRRPLPASGPNTYTAPTQIGIPMRSHGYGVHRESRLTRLMGATAPAGLIRPRHV